MLHDIYTYREDKIELAKKKKKKRAEIEKKEKEGKKKAEEMREAALAGITSEHFTGLKLLVRCGEIAST